MGDPLSATASIIAVIQLSGAILGYIHSVEGASKDRELIAREAADTLRLLTDLRFRLESADPQSEWHKATQDLAIADGPLDQYKAALETLRARLAPAKGLRKTKNTLVWHFTKSELDDVLRKMERLKALTQTALQMDHFKLSQAIQKQVSQMNEDSAEVREMTKDVKSEVYRQRLRTVCDWLSNDNYSRQQKDFINRRQSHTGEWFLKSHQFQRWMDEPATRLFCHGHPGTGKTMLSAIAIDHLQRNLTNTDIAVIYLYCSYKRQGEQDVLNLLRSLLSQLTERQSPLPIGVADLYDECTRRNTQPSLEEVKLVLKSAIESVGRVFCVVDALDELALSTRSNLLSSIRSLQEGATMSILATSRNIPGIEQEVDAELCINIRASESDVKAFLGGHIMELSSCVQRSPALQEEVVAAIAAAIDGMFLLAQLYLDSLKDKRSVKAVRGALRTLASGSDSYDNAYQDAMTRIHSQPKGDVKLATDVLTWIVRAKRPLEAAELQCALAVEPDTDELDPEAFIDVEEMLLVCAGLVTKDVTTNIVRLVHFTAQDYLERSQDVWMPNADWKVLIACLTYRCINDGPSPFTRRFGYLLGVDSDGRPYSGQTDPSARKLSRIPRAFSTFWYALNHWDDHLHVVESDWDDLTEDQRHTLLRLLDRQPLLDRCWECRRDGYDVMSCQRDRFDNISYARMLRDELMARGEFNLLHLAAIHDLERLLTDALSKATERNFQNSHIGTILAIASAHGSRGAVQACLRYSGPEVNYRSVQDLTALLGATELGHHDIVHDLLNHPLIDVNLRDASGCTALLRATVLSDEQIVKLLLESGKADLYQGDKQFLTPLEAAWRRPIIELLRSHDTTSSLPVEARSQSGIVSSGSLKSGQLMVNEVPSVLEDSRVDTCFFELD